MSLTIPKPDITTILFGILFFIPFIYIILLITFCVKNQELKIEKSYNDFLNAVIGIASITMIIEFILICAMYLYPSRTISMIYLYVFWFLGLVNFFFGNIVCINIIHNSPKGELKDLASATLFFAYFHGILFLIIYGLFHLYSKTKPIIHKYNFIEP